MEMENQMDQEVNRQRWEEGRQMNPSSLVHNLLHLLDYVIFDRQRFGSISDDSSKTNGIDGCFDMERLKNEILTEMKKEVNKMKQEIIEGLRIFIHNFQSCVTRQLVNKLRHVMS